MSAPPPEHALRNLQDIGRSSEEFTHWWAPTQTTVLAPTMKVIQGRVLGVWVGVLRRG